MPSDEVTIGLATLAVLGTLGGAALSPWIAARAQRRVDRQAVYADGLAVLYSIRSEQSTLSATPTVPVELELDRERLHQIDARLALLGSKQVRRTFREAERIANTFWGAHDAARTSALTALPGENLKARIDLGGLVDDLSSQIAALEEAMRH